MRIAGHDIGVCSWSLQPKGAADLVEQVKSLGLSHVQLGLEPLVTVDDKRRHGELGHLRNSGLTFHAGMLSFPGEDYSTIDAIRRTGGYVPDDLWPIRQRLSREAARLSKELNLQSVGTHVGFVPHKGKPGYDQIVSRVREIADTFGQEGVALLMETGQEPAGELLQFLGDVGRPNVGVNFDPANMILYGAGDPVAAVRTLGRHVRHVHVKDATASANPGVEWGAEVPFGTGEVDVKAFLSVLKQVGYTGPLAIEREAGTTRAADVRKAVETLRANAE